MTDILLKSEIFFRDPSSKMPARKNISISSLASGDCRKAARAASFARSKEDSCDELDGCRVCGSVMGVVSKDNTRDERLRADTRLSKAPSDAPPRAIALIDSVVDGSMTITSSG